MSEGKYTCIIQKVTGIAMSLLGLVSIPMMEGDITAAVVFIPFGLYIALTREIVIDW